MSLMSNWTEQELSEGSGDLLGFVPLPSGGGLTAALTRWWSGGGATATPAGPGWYYTTETWRTGGGGSAEPRDMTSPALTRQGTSTHARAHTHAARGDTSEQRGIVGEARARQADLSRPEE